MYYSNATATQERKPLTLVSALSYCARLRSLLISYTLYSNVVQQKQVTSRLGMHSFVWGLSTVLTAAPLTTRNYGIADTELGVGLPRRQICTYAHVQTTMRLRLPVCLV